MKYDTTAVRWSWRLRGAALAGIVLMAGAGCNCININLGSPQASSAGGGRPGYPPPSGGSFTPVQSAITGSGGNVTICTPPQTISPKHVNFYPPSQSPNPGENGFRGYLFNVSTGQIISNNTYVLQWIVDIANRGCGTPVANSTTDVFFPATAGTSYKIVAHFKPNQIPPNNPPIKLYGAWITQ